MKSGGTPLLAAAFADALPLRNDAVTGVVSLDVIALAARFEVLHA
jgi:hypothetical protein